jgi:phage terminase small subunit
MARTRKNLTQTNTGHPLTPEEELFIQGIVKGKSNTQAVIDAGYKQKAQAQAANALLNKTYIAEEIRYRMDKLNQDAEETGRRLFEFWWSIVDGTAKDQFGLDVDMGTRIKASQEIAKRVLDLQNRGNNTGTPEIKITLDWGEQ